MCYRQSIEDHKDTAAAVAAQIPIVDRRSLVGEEANRQSSVGEAAAHRTDKAADTIARMAAGHIAQVEGAVVAGTSSTAAVEAVAGMKAVVVHRNMPVIRKAEEAAAEGGKVAETQLEDAEC